MLKYPDKSDEPPADPGTYKNLGPLDVQSIGSIPLQRGDTGKDVIHLQLMLFELGYDFMGTATTAGASDYLDGIDGAFGPGTEAAVKLFQKDHPGGGGDRGDWEGKALQVTGIVEDRTADALNRALVGIWYSSYFSIDAQGNPAPPDPANQLVTTDFDNPLAIPSDWYTIVLHGVPDPQPPGKKPPAGAPIARPDRSVNFYPNDPQATDAPMREVHLIKLHADNPIYPKFTFVSSTGVVKKNDVIMSNFKPEANAYPGRDDDQTDGQGKLTNNHANAPFNFHNAQVHVALSRTLRVWRALGVRPSSWTGGATINVQTRPRGAPPPRFLNAWYANPSVSVAGPKPRLDFFEYLDPSTNTWTFLCNSPDIVSHEAGHAMLDIMRPDLLFSTAFEVGAFHEAFGDISAILTTVTDHDVREALLKAANFNGYIKRDSRSNLVSQLAEEFGGGLFNFAFPGSTGPGLSDPNALRDANNTFVYISPSIWDDKKKKWVNNPNLPSSPPAVASNTLEREIHSFARVFVGGFYDMSTLIFDRLSSTINPDDTALRRALSDAGKILVWALTPKAHSPVPTVGDPAPTKSGSPHNPDVPFFRTVVTAMIRADQTLFSSKYHDDLKSAFGDNGKQIITDAAADAVH